MGSTFDCALCNGTFAKARTDEEAYAEAFALHGMTPEECEAKQDCMVCEQCFQKMQAEDDTLQRAVEAFDKGEELNADDKAELHEYAEMDRRNNHVRSMVQAFVDTCDDDAIVDVQCFIMLRDIAMLGGRYTPDDDIAKIFPGAAPVFTAAAWACEQPDNDKPK